MSKRMAEEGKRRLRLDVMAGCAACGHWHFGPAVSGLCTEKTCDCTDAVPPSPADTGSEGP